MILIDGVPLLRWLMFEWSPFQCGFALGMVHGMLWIAYNGGRFPWEDE